jgi:hypothetical protein
MGSADKDAQGRLWGALMQMRKLDIGKLDAAFRGA